MKNRLRYIMGPSTLPFLVPYRCHRGFYYTTSCRNLNLLSPSFCHSHNQLTPKITQRTFLSTPPLFNWLAPKRGHNQKNRKGRPRVRTGGSTKGTTVVWGDYGLRMRDHDRRISAKQLQIGAETIRKRLRGQRYRLYTRVCANTGVYTSGNEVRMGKGKGSFDYWAARVAVSRILFELKGDLHEQIVRDAFRLAGNKLPGKLLNHRQPSECLLTNEQDFTNSLKKEIRRLWVLPR